MPEVNVTDIIWKAATIRGFTFGLFAQQTVAAANATLLEFLKEGKLQPTISRVFPLSQTAEAVCYLIEDRSFPHGRPELRAPPLRKRQNPCGLERRGARGFRRPLSSGPS